MPHSTLWLDAVTEALQDATATVRVHLGTLDEETTVRIVRGSVRVDWEIDDAAGGCLLRPALLRQLQLLGAHTTITPNKVVIETTGDAARTLSRGHAALLDHLGKPAALRVELRFSPKTGTYVGGTETYLLIGVRVEAPLMQMVVTLRPKSTSAHTPLALS